MKPLQRGIVFHYDPVFVIPIIPMSIHILLGNKALDYIYLKSEIDTYICGESGRHRRVNTNTYGSPLIFPFIKTKSVMEIAHFIHAYDSPDP